jgi:hypothetical protein
MYPKKSGDEKQWDHDLSPEHLPLLLDILDSTIFNANIWSHNVMLIVGYMSKNRRPANAVRR